MKRIFESVGTSLNPAQPEFATWISAQVEMIAEKCAASERPTLRAYRYGHHEYMACDYPSLSLTIRIDPDAKLLVPGPLTHDIFVPDMTDALTLISLIEQKRQGTGTPEIPLATYVIG